MNFETNGRLTEQAICTSSCHPSAAQRVMTNTLCQQQPAPALDRGQVRRLLGAASALAAERGPTVTLSEIAVEASGDDGEPRCTELVQLLLAQRLGDLLAVARMLPDPGRPRAAVPRALWADSVSERVLENLDRPDLSLRGVSRMLAVSPRTLQRRLADEGTSWRAILDAARRERATALMREGATTEAAAARVGYTGSRGLRRAVRRWRDSALSPGGPKLTR
jgi:AraC-like DNA-binding protein